MKRQRILYLAGALALAVLLVGTVALAQGSGPDSPRGSADALGTAFTYQGELKKGDSPVDDSCDMVFSLYNDAGGTGQVGSAITHTVPISDGLFTVVLNDGDEFGASAFNCAAR